MKVINRFLPILVLLVLVLTGCRTYGGYGTVEAHQHAIMAEAEQASGELDAAARLLARLESAAAENDDLQSIAEEWTYWHGKHAALVDGYQMRAPELAETGSYRKVSRALGAMLAEQQRISDAYTRLTVEAALVLAPDEVSMIGVPPHLYGVYPAVYYAWWSDRHQADALSVVRTAG